MNLLRASDAAACVAMIGLLGACAASQAQDCSEARLAEIEAAYVAEAVLACRGQDVETCEALPEIRERYDAMRKEWVQCR